MHCISMKWFKIKSQMEQLNDQWLFRLRISFAIFRIWKSWVHCMNCVAYPNEFVIFWAFLLICQIYQKIQRTDRVQRYNCIHLGDAVYVRCTVAVSIWISCVPQANYWFIFFVNAIFSFSFIIPSTVRYKFRNHTSWHVYFSVSLGHFLYQVSKIINFNQIRYDFVIIHCEKNRYSCIFAVNSAKWWTHSLRWSTMFFANAIGIYYQ